MNHTRIAACLLCACAQFSTALAADAPTVDPEAHRRELMANLDRQCSRILAGSEEVTRSVMPEISDPRFARGVCECAASVYVESGMLDLVIRDEATLAEPGWSRQNNALIYATSYNCLSKGILRVYNR